MSKRAWVMKQEWKDVVFLHWPVEADWLRRFVPKELEIDLYDKQAWIGVVLFRAKATGLRLLPPIPSTRSYLELNVRTYVKYGNRQGVYFFSLDADSRLAVIAASLGGFLPYKHADMSMSKKAGQWIFASRRIEGGQFSESFRMAFQEEPKPIAASPLEQWLTERYCLWTKPKKQLYRVDITHPPWTLHYLKGQIHQNTLASYLPVSLHHQTPICHYSKRLKTRFYWPVKEL